MLKGRRASIAAIATAAFAVLASPLLAMDWPLAPPRVAATFGTGAKGRLVTGLALSAEDGQVRSAEDGEISFSIEEGGNPSGLPMPLGSFVVVEHQKGMAAVYAHLAPGSSSPRPADLRAGDAIGRTGSSGWTEGPGLLFEVFDRRADSWVNPLLVLPPLAVDKAPVIRSLALSRGDKSFVLGSATSIAQGTYTVSVDVVDPADSAWTAGSLAPYAIRLSIDGVETASLVFDVARGAGGKLLLFSDRPKAAEELMTKEGRYSLVERLFPRGRSSLEVRVEDASGNKRSASWSLSVE